MQLFKWIERNIYDRINGNLNEITKNQTKSIVLQSLSIARDNRKKKRIKSLLDVEFSGFSQWGEDGIIDWLFERLAGIPTTFIEFGVQDYRESNTRLLLHLRNWRGLVIDGSENHISKIRRQEVFWRHDLTAICDFIDCANINQIITSSGLSGPIGLLSVDIDGNDYWVWQAIDAVSPAIVVCEYNALFGDIHSLSVPYRADFQRNKAHYSNLYFGASLPALIDLSEQKGYVFVGTNSNGCNAFFVRKDFESVAMEAIVEIKAFPSFFREARDSYGQLTYVRGRERVEVIKHLPVYDFKTKTTCSLGDLGNLYSSTWL